MRRTTRLTSIIGAMTAALALATIPLASEASATNRAPCSETGHLQFNSPSTTCWANKGSASVRLYGVRSVSTGNNSGYFVTSDGKVTDFSWGSWGPLAIGQSSTVIYIRIY